MERSGKSLPDFAPGIMTREHKSGSPTRRDLGPKKSSQGKRKLRIIGKELPDLETDAEFQASWKITKAKEVRHDTDDESV